jgi:NADH dehydrogenase FAD-containing subunit
VESIRLVIIGAGFAGMYAALSSARLREIKGVSPEDLEIALVAPEPTLVVRPRLYEPKPGNNAAAELLGVPTRPYHQEVYVTCLDLGEAGAIFTRGWDRKMELVGAEAKKTKQEINTVWIYPPRAERAAALASADPERVTDL